VTFCRSASTILLRQVHVTVVLNASKWDCQSRYKKHMVSQWDHFLCTYKITITMIQCGAPVSMMLIHYCTIFIRVVTLTLVHLYSGNDSVPNEWHYQYNTWYTSSVSVQWVSVSLMADHTHYNGVQIVTSSVLVHCKQQYYSDGSVMFNRVSSFEY